MINVQNAAAAARIMADVTETLHPRITIRPGSMYDYLIDGKNADREAVMAVAFGDEYHPPLEFRVVQSTRTGRYMRVVSDGVYQDLDAVVSDAVYRDLDADELSAFLFRQRACLECRLGLPDAHGVTLANRARIGY